MNNLNWEKIKNDFCFKETLTKSEWKNLLDQKPICINNKIQENNKTLAFIIIQKNWKKIFNLLANVKLQTEYMPRMKKTDILNTNKNKILARIEIKILTFTIYYHLIFVLDKNKKIITFKLDKTKDNSLKDINGYWKFYSNKKNSTLVEYYIDIKVGYFVPKYIENLLTKTDLPKILLSLKTKSNQI